MDFTQKKLTRAEWESIEIPIAPQEKEIVQMICRGFHNLSIRENAHTSLFSLIKISPTKEMEFALYQKYFHPWISQLFPHLSTAPCPQPEDKHTDLCKLLEITKTTQAIQLKGADKIRIQHLDETIQQNRAHIFEFLLLELCQSLVAPSSPPFSFTAASTYSNGPLDKTNKTHKMNKTHEKTPEKSEKLEKTSKNNKTHEKTPLSSTREQQKEQQKEKNALHPSIFYVYTLNQLKKSSITHINPYVMRFVDQVLKRYQTEHASTDVLYHAYECIEKNPYLIRYEDRTLFPHQKRLFQITKTRPETPKLILYIAPTGTGKTLSPIALAEGFRVIFVCVARHVGFALAQTSISVGRKIATAFGCDTADGIRLHNNAAKEYIRNKRSGGIGKIDHTVGDNVELMICDVQSYIPAMHYMMSFHDPSSLITFWDEPTITLDKELLPDALSTAETESEEEKRESKAESETDTEVVQGGKTIAQMIHRIWAENRVQRMILSCATLPREEEILPVLSDFRARFENAEIHTISSVDCRKSIGLLNSTGYSVLPHCLFENYRELMECVRFCEEDLTTLRYFDLREINRFLRLVRDVTMNEQKTMEEMMPVDRGHNEDDEENQFTHLLEALKFHCPLEKITLQEVKQHYLNVLKSIPAEDWEQWYRRAKDTHMPRLTRSTASTGVGGAMGLSSSHGGNGIRKIQSSSTTQSSASINLMSQEHGGKPLSKIHSIDGSLFHYSSSSSTPPSSATIHGAKEDPYLGILLTTADAHTLTDGPTLYLAENVEKIGQFYIQQSHISPAVFQNIQAKIQHNDRLAKEITRLETELELEYAKKNASLSNGGGTGEEKSTANNSGSGGKTLAETQTTEHLRDQISLLRSQICHVSLDSIYIPNHPTHLNVWSPESARKEGSGRAYYVPLDESVVRQIMGLDIEAYMKLLLLMGIGVFPKVSEHAMTEAQFQYLELMKGLAKEQRLYLIIANSDYIYGTNYQFCHGIIGKDLVNMSQQKQKQAMGRVGRHNVQQEYTVRFRNDELIRQLWTRPSRNIEAENMCLLFSS
jgi:hypothetical protein